MKAKTSKQFGFLSDLRWQMMLKFGSAVQLYHIMSHHSSRSAQYWLLATWWMICHLQISIASFCEYWYICCVKYVQVASQSLSSYLLPDIFWFASTVEALNADRVSLNGCIFFKDCRTALSCINFFPPLYLCCGNSICVSFRPLHFGVKRMCIDASVCFSFSLFGRSAPIRLLCSVMGTQGCLRLAPWFVLICLALLHGSDSLPRKPRLLSSIPTIFCTNSLFSLRYTFSSLVSAFYHYLTMWQNEDKLIWISRKGARGRKKRKNKGSNARLQGNCKHKFTDILLWCAVCERTHSSLWCP